MMREGRRECVGDVLKLAHSRAGCSHRCNQFRLEKLPSIIAASSESRDVPDRDADSPSIKQGFIGK